MLAASDRHQYVNICLLSTDSFYQNKNACEGQAVFRHTHHQHKCLEVRSTC